MADEILTSPGEPVSPPAEQSDHPKVVYAPDVPSRNEAIQDTFKAGLGLTALGTEDATDYAREREVQDKFLAGEDLSPAQMREWHERTNTALQRATLKLVLEAKYRPRSNPLRNYPSPCISPPIILSTSRSSRPTKLASANTLTIPLALAIS